MDLDWAGLGERLRAGRAAHELEQQDVAQRIGVKRGAVYNIETGKIAKVTRTVRDYARLVGWTPDSPERVLNGEEPVLAEQPQPAEPAPAEQRSVHPAEPSDLSLNVRTALREGPLLDSKVIRVPTSGGVVTATIVARGSEGMSPEELLKALRDWEATGPTIVDGETDGAQRS
jgi:DNA-binding XRE family transcriptional regulator